MLLYFVFMIIDSGAFNGFKMSGTLSEKSLDTGCALSVIESLIYLFLCVSSGVSIY